MKHKHHIIPKHMGGTDSKDNLVELTVEEHALAHKVLWEKHKLHEDYLAWQGLAGLMSKEELVKELLSIAGRKGARKSNMKQWGVGSHDDGISSWKRKSSYAPDVDGRKVRSKRFWFNDGEKEGQFSLDNYPENWTRGRLRSVMNKVNPHVSL